MSSRQQFLLPNVTPGTLVRLDTASGSTSPADVVDNLNHSISGALITADGTGRIASGDVYGPVGVTTLYLKTLDGSNNVTGTTTLTSSHAAPSSSGTSGPAAVSKTGAYTAADGDVVLCDASGGNFNVTAPAPALSDCFTVKNRGATGTVTIVPHASENIEGAASKAVLPSNAYTLISDGTDWSVI